MQLPPLHTVLRGGKRAGAKHVPVTLAARSTEIGTLELFCVAKEGSNRWRLEFNVRDIVKDDMPRRPAEPEGGGGKASVTDVWPEAPVQEAARLIRAVYAERARPNRTPQDLTKALETASMPAAPLADRAVPPPVGVSRRSRGDSAAVRRPI